MISSIPILLLICFDVVESQSVAAAGKYDKIVYFVINTVCSELNKNARLNAW